MTTRQRCLAILATSVILAARLAAQVQTEVPPVVPGAKPVTVERVKVHGKALEGNLEGNAVERDTIVFLPPSYAKEKSRRYPVVYALHGYSMYSSSVTTGDFEHFIARDLVAWTDAHYRYHLFHAIRADLLRRVGRNAESAVAYEAAIARTENAAEREFLQRRRRALMTRTD